MPPFGPTTEARPPDRIVLIGLSGVGKTTVARQVARRLGWEWVDTDELVVSEAGRPIRAIFDQQGEAAFRALEREAVARVTRGGRVVIATGGGAPLDVVNRRRLWRDAFVVYLRARPETIAERLAPSRHAVSSRPLVDQGTDPLANLRRLLAQRGDIYQAADWIIDVDGLRPYEAAGRVQRAWQTRSAFVIRHPGRARKLERVRLHEEEAVSTTVAPDPLFAARVATPGGSYDAYAGWNALERLPEWLRSAGLASVVQVIADRHVADLHGERLLGVLDRGGVEALLHTFELSEGRKSLDTAAEVFDALVAARAERRHAILAFGGGVATDLGGFIAATYLRGLPLVHVPTSLLGMVDAAIGGKVAVNHREGKNLIGAFYQPRLVVADGALLTTLPRRELVSGWAEVIKHALIMDPELLDWLERDVEALLALEPEATTRVLQRSIALKAAVVGADEREDGARMTLNYGHTIGHALEAATGYETLLHGEAVAVGMAAAAHIGVRMGLIPASLAERQNTLIERFGLPIRAPEAPLDAVLAAMRLDKKIVGRALRFVLLTDLGKTEFRTDVPAELVEEAVRLVMGQAG